MELAEVCHAVGIDLVAAANVHRIRERQPKNAAPAEDVEAVALGLGVGDDVVNEAGGLTVEVLVEAGLETLRQLGDTGGHGDGVAAERAGLVYGAGGCDMAHHLLTCGIRAHRQAAADNFPKRQHVRLDVVQARRAFEAHAETADDFVEQKQDALARADAAHLPQEVMDPG